MDVKSVSGIVSSTQMMQTRFTSGGRISLPVSRQQSLYARFKYVQGIPASRRQNTVPVSRLKMLDNLISSLHKQQEKTPNYESRARMDVLIDQYSKELHQLVNSSPAAFSTASNADTGMVFSFVA